MRPFRHLKPKAGFTLVELLLSIAIFGMLMVAFLSLFTSALTLTLRAGDRDKTLAGISGKVENSMADETFSDGDVAVTDGQVMISYANPSASPEAIDVEKSTGIGEMKDGTEVVINSYQTDVTG